MKQRFSSLDVCAMVTSLREAILGYRCANVYDSKYELLRCTCPSVSLESERHVAVPRSTTVSIARIAAPESQAVRALLFSQRQDVRAQAAEA